MYNFCEVKIDLCCYLFLLFDCKCGLNKISISKYSNTADIRKRLKQYKLLLP